MIGSHVASCEVGGHVRFGDAKLPLQDHIKILGMNMDKELHFDLHLQTITRQALLRGTALRKVATLLNRRGTLMLYKA